MDGIIGFLKYDGVILAINLSCLIIGYLLIQLIVSAMKKFVIKRFTDRTLPNFVISLIKIVLFVLLIIFALRMCGISTDNAVTIASVLSLGISLALQDVLSSLVNGVVVIVNKYFVEGEYVAIGATEGTVVQITIFATTLKTADGLMLTVPNTTVAGSVIKNYSRLPIRRIAIDVPVTYKCNRDQVKELLDDVMKKHAKVLKNPLPSTRLTQYGDSNLTFTSKCWVKSVDYWDTLFDLNEQFISALCDNDISIDYNQMEVLIKNDEKEENE